MGTSGHPRYGTSHIAQESAHDGTDHGAAIPFLERGGGLAGRGRRGLCLLPTGSFAAGARLVQAISQLPGLDDQAPDVDLRPDGVFVRLFTTAPAPDGLSSRDVELARRISTAAHQLGLMAEPSEVQDVVVTIDALDIAKVLPFWRAVLGYGDRDGGPG